MRSVLEVTVATVASFFMLLFFYNLSGKMDENYNLDSGKIEFMYKFYVIMYLTITSFKLRYYILLATFI